MIGPDELSINDNYLFGFKTTTTTHYYPLHSNCNSTALHLLEIFLNLLNFMKFLSFIFFIIVICIIIENLEQDFNRLKLPNLVKQLVRLQSIVYDEIVIVEITLNGPEKYSIFLNPKIPSSHRLI